MLGLAGAFLGTVAVMDQMIRRVITALTPGDDAERHFDLAAQRIQRALLDVTIPSLETLEIGVHAEPARLVGGDYIDLYLSGERSLCFALGDASGKSLAAALTALMLRYLVRGLIRALGTENLTDVVTHVNAVVSDDLTDGAFITFLLGCYDAGDGRVRVVNAGHEPPLLLRAGAATVESLNPHGLVLGIDRTANFTETGCRLDPGDLFVVYTDGLTEATNERGELYTIARLSDDLVANRALPAGRIAETMFETVRRFSATEFRDDATILVLRRPAAGA